MSKIYLPNASQFDLMNENLAKIANAIASDIDTSTWAGIQKAVRAGVAPDLFPIGTQLPVNHGGKQYMYDVVAHDYFKSAHDKNAHTMTLMCHDVMDKLQFDAREAFYCFEDEEGAELGEGTYNFTLANTYGSWEKGTYQFTLTGGVPVGGVFCIDDPNTSLSMVDLSVVVYDSILATEARETAGISRGEGGTSLGTFGVELNHVHRVVNGSNNYKESAIRQFLNSSASAGAVWKPQTKFDRAPSWKTTAAGFMAGLDSDFLAAVGEVIVPCAANNTYESPDFATGKGGKYTVTDKFYLASQREIFGTASDFITDDSVVFPYYEGATNADRIKYKDGVATVWWLRSPVASGAHNYQPVGSNGGVSYHGAHSTNGVVPVCTIV